MKTLVIIDPQNDFITGTLPVTGAEPAMQALAKALHQINVDHIVVTMDAHPLQHISFEPQGGPWPPHCVKYSVGAAIYEPLMQALYSLRDRRTIHFVEKGAAVDMEEYSAFHTTYPEVLNTSDEILLCGLAGNVCVHTSLQDLIDHGLADRLTVITDASPSLDDGSTLRQLIEEKKLRETTIEYLTK